MSPDGSTTLEADERCRCGATRVRVRLEFGDDAKETTQVKGPKRSRNR
jgi:hypothetical protein